jgi:hypothetical protein
MGLVVEAGKASDARGPGTGGVDHHRRIDPRAVGELDAGDTTACGVDARHLGAESHLDALAAHRLE